MLAARIADAVAGLTTVHNGLEGHKRNATFSDPDDNAAIAARVTSTLHLGGDTATQDVGVATAHDSFHQPGTVNLSGDRDTVEGLVRGVDGVGEIVNRVQVR